MSMSLELMPRRENVVSHGFHVYEFKYILSDFHLSVCYEFKSPCNSIGESLVSYNTLKPK